MRGWEEFIIEHIAFIGVSALLLFLAAILLIFLYFRKQDQVRRESSRFERTYFDSFSKMPGEVSMLIRRADLYPVYAGGDVEHMLGLNMERLKEDPEVLRSITDKQNNRAFQNIFQSWDQKGTLEREFSFKPLSGKEIRWGKMELLLSQDKEYYLLRLTDITKEISVREQLEEELKEAQQENQSKTDFLSKMSHEIRTPMNGILGMLALAKIELSKPQEVKEYLEKAESLSKFLLSLINDVLDMSRIESGKVELEQERFDLFAMSDKLRSMFQKTIEEKGVRFYLEMKDFDVRYVIGDELRLTQVIINFISNAIKFTEPGGSICVTFRQMHKIEDKLHLMIRVRDTGKGIEPEFLSRIFRPFEQESVQISKKYGGSGLGMTISDNLIRLMGGQIVIDSEVGKGSDFTVYIALPIAEGSQKLPKNGETLYEGHRGKPGFSYEGSRILLAEDNEINAEITVTMLQMQGAKVDVASDGRQAVEKFRKSSPGYYQIILMDIQMPELDGWEATKEIRMMDRPDAAAVKIFALSANAFVEDKRHSIEVGMDGHVSKPIDFEELKEMIAQSL